MSSQSSAAAYPGYEPVPVGMPEPVAPAIPASSMPEFGPERVSMMCPYCNVFITTETTSTYSCCAHCFCCLMCCSGGVLTICSCLPYLLCEPGTVVHHCPNCKKKLGVYGSDC